MKNYINILWKYNRLWTYCARSIYSA